MKKRELLTLSLLAVLVITLGLVLRVKFFPPKVDLSFKETPDSVVVDLWRDTDAAPLLIKEHKFNYKLQIFGDGEVQYTEVTWTRDGTETEDVKTTRVTLGELRELLTYLKQQGFFNMEGRYVRAVSGAGSKHIRVNLSSGSKQVTATSGLGAPESFYEIWDKLLALVER